MKKFALVVKYGTGKAVMLTECCDIRKALDEFYEELEKAFPSNNYKDFSLPVVLSVELLPVNYTSYVQGKRFALISKFKYGKSVMVTDAVDIDEALNKLSVEIQKTLPPDDKNNSLINVQACELLPVLYEKREGNLS